MRDMNAHDAFTAENDAYLRRGIELTAQQLVKDIQAYRKTKTLAREDVACDALQYLWDFAPHIVEPYLQMVDVKPVDWAKEFPAESLPPTYKLRVDVS